MPNLPLNFNELLYTHKEQLADILARMESRLVLEGYEPVYASDIVSALLLDVIKASLERRVSMYVMQERTRVPDA